MILSSPPQFGQCSLSISKAKLQNDRLRQPEQTKKALHMQGLPWVREACDDLQIMRRRARKPNTPTPASIIA